MNDTVGDAVVDLLGVWVMEREGVCDSVGERVIVGVFVGVLV